MNIGPIQKLGERVSAYRLRMAIFSVKCLAFFSAILGLMFVIRPEVNNSSLPLAIMFLWFGIPMAVAASALASLGYIIGWRFSIYLESNQSANNFWPKIKVTVACIFLMPFFCFAAYWFFHGLFTMETLVAKRHSGYHRGYHLVYASDNPVLFWYSIFVWSFGLPAGFVMLRKLVRIYKT